MAKLDKVGRVLYRSLMRHARTYDERPALKALICRDLGPALPKPLDNVVAAFLGGPDRAFYWPDPAAPQSLAQAVRQAFRAPAPDATTTDGAFQALRYLSALLNIAQSHGMLSSPPPPLLPPPSSSNGTSTEQMSRPERGALLVAHPCLPSWFSRTVILLCSHDTSGTFGLCLNKPFGGSVLDLISQGRRAGASGLTMDFLRSGIVAGASATTEEAAATAEGSSSSKNDAAAAEAAEYSDRSSTADADDGSPSKFELLDFSSDLSDHGSDTDDAAATREAQQAQQDRVFEALSHVMGPGAGFDDGSEGEWRQLTFTLDEDSAEELLGTLNNITEFLGEGWEGRLPEMIEDLSEQARHAAEGLEGPQKEALLAILEELQGMAAEGDGSGGGKGDSVGNMPFLQPPREEDSPLLAAQGDQPPALAVAGATAAAGVARSQQPAAAPVIRIGFAPDAPTNEGATPSDGTPPSGPVGTGTGDSGDGPASPKQLMAVTPRSLVHLGGPVPGVSVLHSVPELGGSPVLESAGSGTTALHLGTDASLPQAAAALGGEAPQVEPGSVYFFLGSSRWVSGQLEDEIARGSWAVLRPDGSEVSKLLAAAREDVPEEQQRQAWEDALGRLGPATAALAAVPEGVWQDLAALEI